jgi:hypothetical protein
MTAIVRITAPSTYGVYYAGRLLYVDSSMTGAILWAMDQGYSVEVQHEAA